MVMGHVGEEAVPPPRAAHSRFAFRLLRFHEPPDVLHSSNHWRRLRLGDKLQHQQYDVWPNHLNELQPARHSDRGILPFLTEHWISHGLAQILTRGASASRRGT